MVNNGGARVLDAGQAQAYLELRGATVIHPNNFLKTNGCSLYFLSTGEVVLLPGDYSDKGLKGIIFNDKKELEKCLEADHFPVENKTNDPVEKNQHYIKHLDKEIDGIIKAMRVRVGVENGHILSDHGLSALLLALRSQQLSKQDLFFAALVLGEYVRKVNHGQWIILKKYGTYNPYYVPAILYSGNRIFLLWDYLVTFFRSSSVTPESYAALPYVKEPGLQLNNSFFKNNFWGYVRLGEK